MKKFFLTLSVYIKSQKKGNRTKTYITMIISRTHITDQDLDVQSLAEHCSQYKTKRQFVRDTVTILFHGLLEECCTYIRRVFAGTILCTATYRKCTAYRTRRRTASRLCRVMRVMWIKFCDNPISPPTELIRLCVVKISQKEYQYKRR